MTKDQFEAFLALALSNPAYRKRMEQELKLTNTIPKIKTKIDRKVTVEFKSQKEFDSFARWPNQWQHYKDDEIELRMWIQPGKQEIGRPVDIVVIAEKKTDRLEQLAYYYGSQIKLR